MDKLDNIIDIFKELRNSKKLINLTDNCIFEQAIKLYISNNINESKDKRVETMSAQKQETEKKDNKITEKQISFLKKNHYTGNLNITKKEAHDIIQDYLNSLKEENNGRNTSKKY